MKHQVTGELCLISEGCQALFVSNLQSVDFSRFSKYQPPVVCVWFMAPLITVKVSLFVLLLESNNCQHHQHGFPLSQNKHYLPLSLLPPRANNRVLTPLTYSVIKLLITCIF